MDKKPKSGLSRAIGYLTGKGFYIVLFLCVAAIGISGYIIINSNFGDDTEQSRLATQTSVIVTAVPDKTATEDQATPPAVQDVIGDTKLVVDSPAVDDALVESDDSKSEAQSVSETIVWPLSGEVTKNFSIDALVYNKTMNDWRVHNGIDISADVGTNVCSVEAGTISDIYDDPFMGTTVVVDHGNSTMSVYSNLLATPTVSVGDNVEAGQVIGAVGLTALAEISESPHLHLEIIENNEDINPIEFLP